MPDSRGHYDEGRGPAEQVEAAIGTANPSDVDRPNGAVVTDELVGRVISGRYRVLERIATGGMSTVYRGEHIHMLKHVAIKVLDPKAERLPELVQRFQREAIAGAHVQHPNIASATDFGQLEDGSYFLVLEYVSGTSLNHVIAQGPMPVERAVRIGRQIAAALQAAHSLSIVHRDVKPSNVMLVDGQKDFVKLIDFGLAQVRIDQVPTVAQTTGRSSADQPLTGVGIVFGTVAYMAPEASLGMASVDLRSDLYALGIILYEMLAGKHPFDGREPVQLFLQHRTMPPPPIAARTPGVVVPPSVEAVVTRLLEKDPKLRFQTAEDVIGALDSAMLCAVVGVDADLSSDASRECAVPSVGAAALAAVLAEPSGEHSIDTSSEPGSLVPPAVERFASPSAGEERTINLSARRSARDHVADSSPPPASARAAASHPSSRPATTRQSVGDVGAQGAHSKPGPRLPSFADEPSAPPFQLSRPSSVAPPAVPSVPPPPQPPPSAPPPRTGASGPARLDSDAMPTIAIGSSDVLRSLGSGFPPRRGVAQTSASADAPKAKDARPVAAASGSRAPGLLSRLSGSPAGQAVLHAFREHPGATIGGMVGAGLLAVLLLVAIVGRSDSSSPKPAESAVLPTAETVPSASAPPAASAAPAVHLALDELEVGTFKTALRNALKAKDWVKGANAVVSLLKLDPSALREKELQAAMLGSAVGVAQAEGESADKFFADLSHETGTAGLDALYEIARWRAGSKASKRAKELLRAPDVTERATRELRVLIDFYAASCTGKRGLFTRMAEEGDSRAQLELAILRDAPCTRWRDPCCFQENAQLLKAIATLRTRLATREKSN